MPSTLSPVSAEAVRQQVERIVSSDVFVRSDRMKRFLRFVVEQVLEGRKEDIKEYSIAVEVFDKPESFDPRLDPIVRVEAGRLRSKLREYYLAAGRSDSVIISFRRRSYVPVFESRTAASTASASTEAGPARVAARPQPASIAVLPFADLSPEGDQEYFCDGITEEVIISLSRLEGLRVVSRTSSMQFKGKTRDVRQIGVQLNADAVLEGSVRKDDSHLRISAHLISVADGYSLWTEVYDREMKSILTLQEELSRSIARALRVQLRETKPGTGNPEAYGFYLKGLYQWNKRTQESLRRAIESFEHAIAEDPQYALAYSGLAQCYAEVSWLDLVEPGRGWPKAAAAAQTALELDNSLSHAYASLGHIRGAYERDWVAAEQVFQRAIELDGQSVIAHQWYAVFCLAPLRRLDEALLQIQQARQIDPFSPLVTAHLGWIQYFLRQYENAMEQFRKALELDPAFYLVHWFMGLANEQLSRLDEALQAFQSARELSGGQPMTLGALGRCHGLLGQKREARKLLDDLELMAGERYVSPIDLANVHIGLGELDRALELLHQACEDRCGRLAHLRVDPAYDPLKPHTEFVELLRDMSLDS